MKKEFDEREKELKAILEKCDRTINDLPVGSLKIIHKKGNPYYYIRGNGKDIRDKYIQKKEIDTIKKLAQRDYEQKIQKSIKKEMTAISRYSKSMPDITYEEVYDHLVSGRKILITPHFLPDDIFLETWLSEPYEPLYFEEGTAEHYTNKNERVRSKSEVMIANALSKAGIPYKYECPTFLGKQKIYPDFTIMKMPQRKIIYWEHLGLLDDHDYLSKSMHKLDNYESNGIFLGDNLIITRETSDRPLNTKHVLRLIEHYLL
ncbi:hypothetical protein [Butyrivibrio sp. AC2005]|uniref:hypothetical protein n=1 Tax=Butyrivibrio sp. AC2005 TaxID=1280672 RepID=UPI0004276C3F|nr:hypothetical protein [Butyrivibrio sp. AC2005]